MQDIAMWMTCCGCLLMGSALPTTTMVDTGYRIGGMKVEQRVTNAGSGCGIFLLGALMALCGTQLLEA
jgi:hypothetical protein